MQLALEHISGCATITRGTQTGGGFRLDPNIFDEFTKRFGQYCDGLLPTTNEINHYLAAFIGVSEPSDSAPFKAIGDIVCENIALTFTKVELQITSEDIPRGAPLPLPSSVIAAGVGRAADRFCRAASSGS